MHQVFLNLFLNAIQAMPNGGKLAVKAIKGNNQVIVVVEDTGSGIPDEAKAKLFTPLFTTKAKEQGFGLPVVKRLVEAQGGTISFESQEGKGTTFMLHFPFSKNRNVNTNMI